jgi:hypothetical protein
MAHAEEAASQLSRLMQECLLAAKERELETLMAKSEAEVWQAESF